MPLETLLPLLVIIAAATYFQTVTGFGLGLIVMGIASGFDLAPVPLIAAVVSLVTLANSAVALPGRMQLVDWRAARAVIAGVVPAIFLGVVLLDYVSNAASLLLKFLLGLAIIYSGVAFAVRPAPLRVRSRDSSFFVTGLLSGVFGGLFGMAGPPAIFHFYRQPMEQAAIRSMLLLLFAVTSLTRTTFVAAQGGLTRDIWILSGFAVVFVAIATYAGRRYPPPLSPIVMRRTAFIALILIGLGLVASTTAEYFAS